MIQLVDDLPYLICIITLQKKGQQPAIQADQPLGHRAAEIVSLAQLKDNASGTLLLPVLLLVFLFFLIRS